MKYFFFVVLWAGCNEIESNKHWKLQNVSRGEESMKKKMKVKTQNKKIVETGLDIWSKQIKKQLLELRRNSVIKAQWICF